MASSSGYGDVPFPWGDELEQGVRGIIDLISAERKKLEEERVQLEHEKEVWLQAKSNLEASQLGECLSLNVGGTTFACSVDLLRKIPETYFSSLVSGRWEVKKQKDGSLFIDRDPTVFPLIMTFLRKYGTDFDHLKWYSMLSKRELLLLKDEADFYMLPQILCHVDPGSIVTNEEWEQIHPEHLSRKLIWASSYNIPFAAAQPMMMLGNMVVLVAFADGSVLGSYSSVAWTFAGDYQGDPNSFLICKQAKSAVLLKYSVTTQDYAHKTSNGVVEFGFGPDLALNLSSTRTPSISCKPHSFHSLPNGFKSKQSTRIEFWRLGEWVKQLAQIPKK